MSVEDWQQVHKGWISGSPLWGYSFCERFCDILFYSVLVRCRLKEMRQWLCDYCSPHCVDLGNASRQEVLWSHVVIGRVVDFCVDHWPGAWENWEVKWGHITVIEAIIVESMMVFAGHPCCARRIIVPRCRNESTYHRKQIGYYLFVHSVAFMYTALSAFDIKKELVL